MSQQQQPPVPFKRSLTDHGHHVDNDDSSSGDQAFVVDMTLSTTTDDNDNNNNNNNTNTNYNNNNNNNNHSATSHKNHLPLTSSDDLKTSLIIVCNIVSSVSLIMINKIIMKTYGFSFVLFLTFCHFAITALLLELCGSVLGMFIVKRLPMRDAALCALVNVGSILFMNLSLQTNSVGFYQITKLLCIPATVFVQSVFYGMKFTWKVKVCLTVIVFGVGVVTVTDLELNTLGTVYGVCAILCTSVSQIMLGEGQSRFKLSPLQMLHSILFPQAVFALFVTLPVELIPKMSLLIEELSNVPLLLYILLSCIVSVSVNFFTIALIGATSAVTSQVIGHLKVILVLVFGHLLFDASQLSHAAILKEVIGVSIALTAVTFYSHLKKKEASKETDLCDQWFGVYIGSRNIHSSSLLHSA